MAIIITLWIGNGAVLKSSSQWQLKDFLKLNNSGHELFIFIIYIIIYYSFDCTKVLVRAWIDAV